MDRSPKQNINKDIVQLNNTLDQMDLTDIYRNFHLKEIKYTLFSNVHDRAKISINKFKKIEIISSIFLDHKGLKLETRLMEILKNTQTHGD